MGVRYYIETYDTKEEAIAAAAEAKGDGSSEVYVSAPIPVTFADGAEGYKLNMQEYYG